MASDDLRRIAQSLDLYLPEHVDPVRAIVLDIGRLRRAEQHAAELKEALRDAIDYAVEGWAYADQYYRDKWEHEKRVAELRNVLERLRWHTGST